METDYHVDYIKIALEQVEALQNKIQTLEKRNKELEIILSSDLKSILGSHVREQEERAPSSKSFFSNPRMSP